MKPGQETNLLQQVVGTDLQSLDLCQQLHVLHLVVRDDLKAVLIVTTEDTKQNLFRSLIMVVQTRPSRTLESPTGARSIQGLGNILP